MQHCWKSHVLAQIKRMKCRTTCKQIFFPYIHTQPLGWCQKAKIFFLKVVMLHIKIKRMELRTTCTQIICPITNSILTLPGLWSKGQKILKVVMLHIKLKGMKHKMCSLVTPSPPTFMTIVRCEIICAQGQSTFHNVLVQRKFYLSQRSDNAQRSQYIHMIL